MGWRKQCSETEMLHEWVHIAEETMPSLKDEMSECKHIVALSEHFKCYELQ